MNVYKNITQLISLKNCQKKDGRSLLPEDLGVIQDGAIVFDEKTIQWVGKTTELPLEYKNLPSKKLEGHILMPELVDCHTHIVFGGNRSFEYTMRLNGADYQEIAQAGGGILNTMTATNTASYDELFQLSCERIERLHSYGVGTIEIKSGYGLNKEKEREISLLINDLKKKYYPKVQILNTYMAAHAVPKSFKNSSDYIQDVVIPLLKELAPLNILDAVDIFHERGYFETADVRSLFDTAQTLGIPVKSHADEFNDNKGALLACEYGALSTDHLLCTGEDAIEALSNSQTVATFLPGTGFFLGKKQVQARKFLDRGVKVAIGSDYNPGSCHFDNILFTAAIAAPQYRMNISELVSSITLNAAHALGLSQQGALIPGFKPRFSIFKTNSLDELFYFWGRNFSLNKTH